jgi:regulator of protease activity HflC (stomatin/prohibitin superfamily)
MAQQLKDIFGQYTAQEAIQQRTKLSKEVYDAVAAAAVGYPVKIDGVQIENIDFSDAYEKAVEERMTAEVAVAKQRQTLEKEKIEAEIAVTQANGRANSVKAEADAAAYAQRVKGDAEAHAIEARGKALKDNPDLPTLVQAERWDGKLPSTMLPGNAVPMLNIGK